MSPTQRFGNNSVNHSVFQHILCSKLQCFGCFFLVQSLPGGQGNQAVVFGQFIRECEGDNVPGPNSVGETGPQIIQLYKTYIDNSRTPSSDS